MVNLKDHISDKHRRASKMLAYALHADSVDIWSDAALVWRARLTDRENATLAYSMLRALDQDHAVHVVEAVFDKPDMPMVPLFSATDEAANWADWADGELIRAVMIAAYNRLIPSDQADFLRHVTERVAA